MSLSSKFTLLSVLAVGGIVLLASALSPVPVAVAQDPPVITDLAGVWDMTLNTKAENLLTGEKLKDKENFTATITVTPPTTIQISFGAPKDGKTIQAHYANGYVVVAGADATQLATEAQVGVLQVSGKPGKLKISGEVHAIELGATEMLETKVSLKQLQEL